MNAELEILGVKLKHYRVDAAMEIAEEYLSNDKLNTIGIVTMQMLMQASKEPTWKQYIEDLDLTVIGETEVLEAAGIDPETPSYEEVETNEFIARFFWGLIQKKSRIFVLGDTEEELQTLQKYLTETYPGIEIGGGAVVETLEESAFDSLVNEINSQTTDVIVSGLAGTRQDRFVLENSSKISAKIWLSLGEHSTLQNEAGIKTSWWGTLLKKNTFKWMVTKYNSEKDGHLCWDVETLLKEIHTAIQKAGTFDSLGFDTWGVDFGLLDADGHLLANPVHYRDARTNGKPEQAAARMPAEELYAHTGNQIMVINTLFQLLALREQDPELLQKAAQILFMPDLFAALLGAEPVCERSIASTSQMLDPRTGQWSREVLAAYGLPENRFAPIVSSGTVTGTLANGAKIIAVAGHDTQCASATMPCAEEDAEHTAFLSCGTWSLLGTELDAPILTADSCQSGLSNELGANGKINYLKNIIGLWLIQESRREYKRRGQAYSFAELEQQALAAEPLRSFIDPDAPEFVAPGDLPGRIQEFCRRTGQPIPETMGAVMRCIYESLALKYRYAIEQLSAVTGRAFTTLHVLGGGTKDRLLCQMTADCCGLTVKAGPVEATALGNIMIQLKALGLLDSITQGRRLIAETEVIKTYTPSTQNYAEWNAAYDRFKTLL